MSATSAERARSLIDLTEVSAPRDDTAPTTLVLASFVLLLLSFSTYHVARTYPISQAAIQIVVFGSFLIINRRHPQVRVRGWSFMLIGSNLVTFGSLIEISHHVPWLHSPLTEQHQPFRIFLQQVVGHNTGLLLFAFGLFHWVPAFLSSRQVMEEMVHACERQLVHNEKLTTLAGLLAGVAHELKNPLTIVLGYTSMLLRNPALTSVRGILLEIHRAGERCDKISKNLVSFAHRPTQTRTLVQLADVVEDALGLLNFSPGEKVTVQRDVEPGLPAIVADRDQILQVMVNLIHNARQALASRTGERTLRVGVRRCGDAVELEVTDNGPGIPPELMRRIFVPFFTTKPPGEGTGLGLPICEGILKAHGGSIRVASEPGRSTSFTCTLPAAAL